MIKQALEYIVGLNKPEIIQIGDEKYTDKHIERIQKEIRAEPLKFRTLSGLIQYIKDVPDTRDALVIVQVVSPTEVSVYSTLDNDRKREVLVSSVAQIPEVRFGSFIESERFVIMLQSMFVQSGDINAIMKFAGASEAGTVASYGDDGISQKVTVRQGITSSADDIVPSPALLRPYRTFTEVEQPESTFIFRMKDSDNQIGCALFEADGGAWKNTAMNNIKAFLEENMAGSGAVVIS